jgi:hypothetical protein
LPNDFWGLKQGAFGKFIRRYIYAPLANSNGAILEMLDEKNPVVYTHGGRRYNMTQFLSDVVGVNAFRAHLWKTIGIGSAARTKEGFDRAFGMLKRDLSRLNRSNLGPGFFVTNHRRSFREEGSLKGQVRRPARELESLSAIRGHSG